MQQFFAEPSWITESEILIRGADLNHMKNVLRMKVGEDVRINDGQGTTYLCCLNRYEKDQAVLDVFRKLDTETELPSEIILFQGLPKGDKMEWIVQKSVELGAHKIVPFSAKRSVVKLDEKKAVKKQERWQLIAKGAAEQSGRGVIPEVCGVCSFTEAYLLVQRQNPHSQPLKHCMMETRFQLHQYTRIRIILKRKWLIFQVKRMFLLYVGESSHVDT